VAEHVEKANDNAIIAKLKLAEEDGTALLVVDSELGKRGQQSQPSPWGG
jgi:ferritin